MQSLLFRTALAAFLFASSLLFSGEAERPVIQPFKLWKDVQSPELKSFNAPVAERFELANGMVVFLLEDHELPLLELSMTLRFGEIHEPAGTAGLADAAFTVMRSGGSEKYSGDKLDETLEDMAAELKMGAGTDSSSASLSCLKDNFDKGLDIFVDVLRRPAFPEDKLDLHLAQARTAISKRNDSPNSIVGREFKKALYGEKSPYAKVVEYAHLNKIDRAALQRFHSTYFHPNQFILGIVGDFKKAEMLQKVKAAFESWPKQNVALPAVQPIDPAHKKKVLFVDRPKINQTTFTMGHVLDLRRNSKEYPAIQVLNDVLSGSMSARMFTEVRTKKGLAYSVWGYANINYDRPGTFACTALTRNEQALESVDAVREEVVRIREKGITAEELEGSRERILNSFVFNFDSPSKIINRQITYELYGYPMDFAEKLLESIKKVTVDDVNKAAKKFLDPDKMVLLGVGNTSGLDESKTFRSLKDVQIIDVTIPLPQAEPMVIDPRREQEGKKLLAECLKAAGGLEVYQGIQNVRADVILHHKGFKLRGCMRAQMPENVRVDVAGPFGPISQVMAKDAAWKASGSSVTELKPAEAKKNLRTLLHSDLGLLRVLASGKEGYNVQALDPVRENDRELVGVEIESQSLGRIKIWFDAQTKLMAKIRYVADVTKKDESGSVQKEYDKLFTDHAAFGKMILARTITDKDPAGPQTIEMQAVQINAPLDKSLFERPTKATPPPGE
ncbi:MAG TPA: pitrilysin family protein [Planctomycetota bacterium]|nr:pitrilysin family protein [Planctomycetota bacterium]